MAEISVDKTIFSHPVFQKFHSVVAALDGPIALTIDSRSVPEASIFFALVGELHDGHDFVNDALSKGAIAAVVKKNHPKCVDIDPACLIEVDDPLATFGALAAHHIASMPAIRIALTGSNGKTTTKEMLKAALSHVVGSSHVFASPGNKNNHIGLPLSAFHLNSEHHFAIFEMGMNHPGEIAYLCEIVRPQFGLITNISSAHEGNFSDGIKGVQKAKAEIFDGLSHDGHAIVNLDDPRVVEEADKRAFSRTSFGWSANADVRLVDTGAFDERLGKQAIKLEIDNQTVSADVPLPGLHHAMNAAAALAVVKALGLDAQKAALGIANMTITTGRMNVVKNPRGCTIVNDGYNANPSSMAAGILAMQGLLGQRLIAVIGAMGELGSMSAHHHFELGKLLAVHFDRLFICGANAQPTVEGALSTGYPKEKIIFKKSSIELVDPLKVVLEKGDLVFIKGSLSANMHVVAQALIELQ